MSTLDYSNGPVNTALFITYYLTSCFILLCATPFFLHFKTGIRWIFGYIANTTIHTYFSTAQIFGTLHEWYNLWEELWQLQPSGQQSTQLNTNHQLTQTLPPHDEYIMEIRQQWISTPFEDQTIVFQDLQQDFQISNVELSFYLHAHIVSLERIYAPPVVHNEYTLTELIEGKERCLKVF